MGQQQRRKPGLSQWGVLATAAFLAACASNLNVQSSPARPAASAPVRASLQAGAGGSLITIDDPSSLPTAVREAKDLKVAVGGVSVSVQRSPGGTFTFSLPASAALRPDLDGQLSVVFVMEDRDSQVVALSTGSPVRFGSPAVQVQGSAFIEKGLKVKLKANTQADPAQFRFSWSAATTPQGPFQNIPGQGLEVEWEPLAAGNYFVKVDVADRSNGQQYSSVTADPVVFVGDGKQVISTLPASGGVSRGQSLGLKFKAPEGLSAGSRSHAWSFGPSAQGPWTPITGSAEEVSWLPTSIGSYFLRVEVTNASSGQVNTFVSPVASVFVGDDKPIVGVDAPNVQRGDRVQLSFNVDAAQLKGPYSWSYSRSGGGPTAQWTPISGAERSIPFLVNEAGAYHFRVDAADATGVIRSLTTTEPVVNVAEPSTPLITSEPVNATVVQGSSVTLRLNARGVTPGNYRLLWYAGTSPLAFSPLPVDDPAELMGNTYRWRTQRQVTFGVGITQNVLTASGAYFIKVDATDVVTNRTYSFTSTTPVVTVLTTNN